MSSPSDVAAEFVRSYYTKLAYQPSEIPKFYDEERATIWRAEVGGPLAIPFAAAREFLVPHIEEGSAVSVVSFHVLPLESGFGLVAEGGISHGGASSFFTQCFTLGTADGRFFVLADSLTIRSPAVGPPPTDDLVSVRPPKRIPRDGEERPAPKPGKRSAKRNKQANDGARFVYKPT
jgi:hypothetical protein